MARFVLVHGAFAGAWIWGPLAEKLRASGHTVETLDLPGSGDDDTPIAEVTLDSCARRVCDVLVQGGEPALVVGNSMGGIIATQAAARSPDKTAAIVYVAAFIPKDGQSLLDLTHLPEGADDQVQANITIEGEPAVATMPAEASREAFYACSAADVTETAIARQRPQAVAPFATPVSIPAGALDGIDRYYVLCRQDRSIPPALQRRMIAENPCADVVELDTDHTPQLSATAQLAEALDRFASNEA
jgi:pimeloyl-ACP methyl ester carboxylesterase